MAVKKTLLQKLDDLLEWNPVSKSILILLILLPILVEYLLFQLYQYYWPSPYINYEVLISLWWGLPLAIAACTVGAVICHRFKRSPTAQWLVPYVVISGYSVLLAVMAYTIGLLSLPVGLVLVGGPLFGIVLFPRRVIIFATGLAVLVLVTLSLFSAYNYIPYAPLFQDSVFYDPQARPFYLMCMAYFSIPHVISIGGLCDFMFRRWRQRELNIHQMSVTDALTGLRNRRSINDYLESMLKQASNSRRNLSVVLMDIDYFKNINDQYGHLIGDKALQVIALTLQSTLRKADSVGRYGGEEFLIVLEGTSLEQAALVAERCRVAINNAFVSSEQGKRIYLTASFGVSDSEQYGYEMDTLITHADKNLYMAKRQGRNQVVFDSDDVQQP